MKHFLFSFLCIAIINAWAQPGLKPNGFYEDFDNDSTTPGLTWWHATNSGSSHALKRDSGLLLTITRENQNWDPLGVSFIGLAQNDTVIDLSQQAKIKTKIANLSPYEIEFRFAFEDNEGNIIDVDSNIINKKDSPWDYWAISIIKPGQEKEVVFDLSNGKGVDMTNDYALINPNLSQIKSLHITAVNHATDENYQPLAIYDAQFYISYLSIGTLPDAVGETITKTGLPVDSSKIPIDTSKTTAKTYSTTDSSLVTSISAIGLNNYGFYETFQTNDSLNWFANNSNFSINDNDSLIIDFQQEKGQYEPIVLSFGKNQNGAAKTIDVSAFAQLEALIYNPSNHDTRIWFGLQDIHGNRAEYLAPAKDTDQPWKHEASTVLKSAKQKNITLDLTKSVGYDYGKQKSIAIDLQHIQSLHITILSPELDPNDAYAPYAINGSLIIKHIKLGRLDGFVPNITGPSTHIITKYGCIDKLADNYNPVANTDNGSCYYSTLPEKVEGCTLESALNFNEFATMNNGSCVFEQEKIINLPYPILTGLIEVDTLEATEVIKDCNINFNLIVDSTSIVGLEYYNESQTYILWKVYQQNEVINIKQLVDNNDLNSDKLVIAHIACSASQLRVTTLNTGEISLVGYLRYDQILSFANEFATEIINDHLVFPNPFSASFNYSTTETGILKVFNEEGVLLIQKDINHSGSINTENWNTGIYYIQLQTNSSNTTTKLSKQ